MGLRRIVVGDGFPTSKDCKLEEGGIGCDLRGV